MISFLVFLYFFLKPVDRLHVTRHNTPTDTNNERETDMNFNGLTNSEIRREVLRAAVEAGVDSLEMITIMQGILATKGDSNALDRLIEIKGGLIEDIKVYGI